MPPTISGHFWWPLLGAIAVQTTFAFALGFALQRLARSASWRRTIGRVSLLAAAALVLCELAGIGPAAAGWARRQLASPPAPVVIQAAPRVEPIVLPPILFEPPLQTVAPATVQFTLPPSAEESIWWPALLWIGGIAFVLLRAGISHAWLAAFWPRQAVRDELLLQRVQALAGRLKVRRRIRVVESPRLAGPMTFGLLGPAIGLPPGFTRHFTSAQQDAMLAHELAHVAECDPLWMALADGVCALLWWQPLAWWARRRLRAAAEEAADEASLIVQDGPELLAECLVQLGRRLTHAPRIAGLGIEGGVFRSGMGRRVQRLLGLGGSAWRPPRRMHVLLAKMLGTITLIALVLLLTAWTYPPRAAATTWREAIQQSALAIALAVALPAEKPTTSPVANASPAKDANRIDWKAWSRAAVEQARAEGKPVLVDFTALWCVTAKVNERTSLEVEAVRAKLQELGVVTLRADYTVADAAIAEELRLFDRAGVPLVLVYSAAPDAPPKVLPELLTPQLVLEALDEATSPTAAKPAPKPEAAEPKDPKNNAPKLILEGKALMDAGKLAEAEVKLNEALKLDPANGAPKEYLNLLQRKRAVAETLRLQQVPTNSVPVLGDLPFFGKLFTSGATNAAKASFERAATNAYLMTNSLFTDRGRERLMQMLDTIRLEKVSFDGVPLHRVAEVLNREVQALDSVRRGVNFIVPGEPDNSDIVVRVQPPLRDVTLRQALDAIVHGAQPQLWYSIEDYAIVFSLDSPKPPLHTRWFKIDRNTFIQGIRNVRVLHGTNVPLRDLDTTPQTSGIPVDYPPVKRANELGVLPPRGNRYSGTTVTPAQAHGDEVLAGARRLFSIAGVDFGQPGKTLVYNDRLGALMIRATLQELDLIEQTIQVLNMPPRQVAIEVKFCEIDEEDRKALGFDWLPGRVVREPVPTDTEQPEKPLFDGTLESLVAGTANAAKVEAARKAEDYTLASILTAPQSRVVLRALEQRRGVSVMSSPKVTTLSGRQAQIKSVEVRYIVTGLDPATNASSNVSDPRYTAETFELGPVIDVIPYVQPDGVTIAMTVIPTIKEFVGYDLDSEKRIRESHQSGDPKSRSTSPPEAAIPLPVFRLRQIVTTAIVHDGQTLVLSGGSMTFEQNGRTLPADAVVQKGAARLFGGQKSVNRRKSLLVFVTPTLIDAAGNRIHPEDQSPPPQSPSAPSR